MRRGGLEEEQFLRYFQIRKLNLNDISSYSDFSIIW